MSLAIAHFAFGAAMTTLVVMLLLPDLRFSRTLVLVGGGWAMVPDLHQISPAGQAQLYEFHRTSPVVDLFWFHRTLDSLDPADSKTVAAVLLAVFIVTTLVAEYRSYRTPGPVADAYETYLDIESKG